MEEKDFSSTLVWNWYLSHCKCHLDSLDAHSKKQSGTIRAAELVLCAGGQIEQGDTSVEIQSVNTAENPRVRFITRINGTRHELENYEPTLESLHIFSLKLAILNAHKNQHHSWPLAIKSWFSSATWIDANTVCTAPSFVPFSNRGSIECVTITDLKTVVQAAQEILKEHDKG